MMNPLQMVGLLYIACAQLYGVVAEVYLSRLVRMSGEFEYGSFRGKILERESILYSRVVSGIISFGGITFALLSLFTHVEDWFAAVAANVPFLFSIIVLGFSTRIAEMKGFVMVLPAGSPKKFIIPYIAAFLSAVFCPFVWNLVSYHDGIIEPLPISVTFIPMGTFLAIVFFPIMMGGWLFGTKSFTDALPSFLKNRKFAPFFAFMLANYLFEILPKSLPFILANLLFALLLLAWSGVRNFSPHE